jgi:competence protein ComEC
MAFVLALVVDRVGRWPRGPDSSTWLAVLCGVLWLAHWWALRTRLLARRPILSLLLFFALGLLAARVISPLPTAATCLEPFLGKRATLFLAEVVAAPDPQPEKTRLTLRLHRAYSQAGSNALGTGVLLTLRDCRQRWLPGQFLLARLSLKRIHGFRNPGGYDYEGAQAARGIFASAFLPDDGPLIRLNPAVSHLHLSGAHSTFWLGAVDSFRLDALEWLKTHLTSDTASIYAALLLGFQNQVPKSVREHWNRAGVTHLLSISGQHLAMVAMAAFWLLCRLFRFLPPLLESVGDQRLALWGALILAVLYAAVGGLSLPTWRSAIMLTLFFVGIAFYRATDSTSAMSLAALFILVLEPEALWTASFQLTFAAMAGIFLVYPRLYRLRQLLQDAPWQGLKRLSQRWRTPQGSEQNRLAPRILTPFADAFWISLAANVMVLPLVVFHFHGISVVGFLANTILVPLTGFLVLPLGLLALAVFAVNEPLALLFLVPGGWAVDLAECLIEFFSQRSWAYHWVGDVGIVTLLLLYGMLAVALSSWRWRTKWMVLGGALAGFGLMSLIPHGVLLDDREQVRARWHQSRAAGCLQVLFVDVGQGSSTLVGYPDGTILLLDGGGFHDDSFDIGRNVLAPLLWYLGIDRLDRVILSHDHPDHANGLRFILSHFRVGSYWESGIRERGRHTPDQDLAMLATHRKIPVQSLGNIFGEHSLGGCRLRIRHPSHDYLEEHGDGADLNNVSLVVEVDHQNTRLVLPGDIDQSVEELLYGSVAPVGKVLVAASHHGSQRSNGGALLDGLQPDAVVFSCGYGNWFGFPHEAVLERLKQRSIRFHRTDLEGAIWAVSDGNAWSFSTMLSPGDPG